MKNGLQHNLRESRAFSDDAPLDGPFPWPELGEGADFRPGGSADFVYPLSALVSDEMERSGSYEFQYRDAARELVRAYLRNRLRPENVIFPAVTLMLWFTDPGNQTTARFYPWSEGV